MKGKHAQNFDAEVLGGAEGAVYAMLPTPEIALPFEGVFKRAA